MSQQKQSKLTKHDNFNVDDLLDESDDDDNDELFDDDEEMEKFKQKAGLTTSKYKSDTTSTKTSTAPALTTQFHLQALTQKEEINKLIQQQIKPKEEKKKEDLKKRFDVNGLSSSDDSDDEDIEQFIANTKNPKASATQLLKSTSTQGNSSYDKKQDSFISDKHSKTSDFEITENETLLKNKEQIQQQQQQYMDILDVIEKNEKMNEVGPDKIMDHSSQLLSFDNKFYNVQKKLFDYNDFGDIAKKLHQQKNHQFGGIVSAIHCVQNYLFVGNSSGIIRVFDLKSQKEMKPLMDESQIGGNKVTSIDISEDGGFLLSGYKKGQVALWDLQSYKLVRFIQDIHVTEVVNARIYHTDDSDNLFAVSAEDSGRVQLLKFSKKTSLLGMGGYSSEAQFLFKTRLKGTASLAVHKKNPLYPHDWCDKSSLIAFGSLNEIVVCQMRPIKEIFQLNRPSFCKEKSIPYCDWGYGLTPGQRDRTVPILAFAWDRLIQLVYINEQTQTIEMDGFYYSDHEINSLYFMGDSILFVLVNGREVKVLYTTKFYPGHFKFLENAKKDDLLNNQFEKVIQVTAHSELEKGFEISDIKSNLLQSQMVMNYNQSVKRYKNLVFFMCGKTIVRGKLFTWKEYLDHIKLKENYDWLTVLKVALEIYNGDTKGYCKVPDEKESREQMLKGVMKEMIKESVNQVIFKYASAQNNKDPKSSQENYQADAIAIKVAIEFCLSINSTFYLFNEIYQIFQECGLENKFIANLEPFILAGSFRKESIPENIIKKIITYYEERNNLKALEKVIQQMDLSEYSQRDELMVTCQVHCLIGALLYLMSSQHEEQLGCMQILNTLLTLMRKAQIIDINKEDVLNVCKVDAQRKYEIEKSRAYIGYKLLWIVKMFLDGKTFPSGFLSKEKQMFHTFDIVNFFTNDQFLEELLQFDAEAFFKVISKCFYGTPLKYLKQQREYFEVNQIKGFMVCMPIERIINELLKKKSEVNKVRLDAFYRFIVIVQSFQDLPENAVIDIDYDLVYSSVNNIINDKKETNLNEEQIIMAIRSKKFKKPDIDKLLQCLEQQIRTLPHLMVFLLEKKKDYVQSFKLNITNSQLRKGIFEWINKTLDKLSRNGKSLEPFENLKSAIQRSIKELIQINVGECIVLLDKWFEDSYQEQLILDELADYPDVQYNYIKKFIKENEAKIQQAISEATYSIDRKAESQRYLQYLILHTKLLCKFDQGSVHDFVKKDYYPIQECLDICKQFDAQKGVAVLLRRNGNYLESINSFLQIAQNIDILEIMKELVQSTKGQSSTQLQHFRWEFMQCSKLAHVHEFDQQLRRSLNIAEKHQAVIGEEGWFIILEYLSNYRQQIADRIQAMVKNIDKAKIEKVRDFIAQRKNHILKIVPASIGLQTLCDRLNLDFKQIKKLYDHKVQEFRNNGKYLKLAFQLNEKELNNLKNSYFTMLKEGFQLKEDQRCEHCQMQIAQSVQKLPFKMYYCQHTFHSNCVKDKKCPICVQKHVELKSKSERKKSNALKKGGSIKKDMRSSEKSREIQNLAESAFQQQASLDIKGDSKIDNMGLYQRRMEVFDTQCEQSGLQYKQFQKSEFE